MFLAQKWSSLFKGGGRRGGTWTGVWGWEVQTTVAPYDSVNDQWSNTSGWYGRLTVTKDKPNKRYYAQYWVHDGNGTAFTFTGYSSNYNDKVITVTWTALSTTVTWSP